MADADVRIIGLPSRLLPQAAPENVEPNDSLRVSSYREIFSPLNREQLQADEGSYFHFTNPTIGTGVAHANLTAFAQTSALFAILNSHPTKSLFLDHLMLTLTATVPTTKLTEEILVQVDADATRTPTANLALLTPQPSATGVDFVGKVFAFSGGLLTVPTGANSGRVVSRAKIPLNVSILHDVYTFLFKGPSAQQAGALTAVRATQAASFVATGAPVVAKPNEWIIIYRFGAGEATNANTYEYSLGLIQR